MAEAKQPSPLPVEKAWTHLMRVFAVNNVARARDAVKVRSIINRLGQ